MAEATVSVRLEPFLHPSPSVFVKLAHFEHLADHGLEFLPFVRGQSVLQGRSDLQDADACPNCHRVAKAINWRHSSGPVARSLVLGRRGTKPFGREPSWLSRQSAEHRVKLRSSIMLGFVSFNSLLGSPVPTRTVTPAMIRLTNAW